MFWLLNNNNLDIELGMAVYLLYLNSPTSSHVVNGN